MMTKNNDFAPNERSSAGGPPKIFESEYRFCRILWENEPIPSGELVRLCAERLGWKKPTTYTVIRRLAERGVLKNEGSVVTALVTQQQVQAAESTEFLEKTFDGSLPQFFAAFTSGKKLKRSELEQLRRLIDEVPEDDT